MRKRRLLIVCVVFFAAALVLRSLLQDQRESTFESIQVRGSESFVKQVEASLRLLREKSPDAFKLTQQYVPRIQESRRSGMHAYAAPPTFHLNVSTACYSTTWCAGSIAHDTYHSKLYHEYRDAHGDAVPDDAWTGLAKELECIYFQQRVLREIGAPQYEIAYLNQQDGTHYDVDGDGHDTWKDYWKRDW